MRALKLYSVWPVGAPKFINRPALVEGLLSICERFFGSPPQTFDIHGPYGITKGTSVGVQAFRNKLAKRGHDDYYALDGRSETSFGFSCLFEAKADTGHSYDQLLVWFAIERHHLEILDLAENIIRLFPADYGFVEDFSSDYNLMAEARRKKTLSGYTLEPNLEHSRWTSAIATVLEGKIRKVYRYNFLNSTQVEALTPLRFPPAIRVVNGVSMVWLANDGVFETCTRRHSDVVPAA
jgi:hypothetical protein